MYIQTEVTPNPNALKFLPGVVIKEGSPVRFSSGHDCEDSLLAKLLLSIENVREVFFAHDFITITKDEEAIWDVMKPEILVAIMNYLVSGQDVMNKDKKPDNTAKEEDSDLVIQIKEIIEEKVRPAVAQDGGDIIFRGFEDGVVKLELRGACSGCPSSSVTLKNGIENMLKHYVPEVLSVEEFIE